MIALRESVKMTISHMCSPGSLLSFGLGYPGLLTYHCPYRVSSSEPRGF